MAWNPNLPNANDKLSVSQGQIKANFQALDPLFNQGTQDVVRLPAQPTVPTTDAAELALYSKDVSGTPQLFMRQQSNGTEYNFTSAVKSAGTGFSYLPSGIILRWGSVNITSNPQTYVLPVGGGIPAYTQIFQIQLTPKDTSSNTNFTLGLRSVTGTTAFTVYCTNPTAGTSMNYFIVGI